VPSRFDQNTICRHCFPLFHHRNYCCLKQFFPFSLIPGGHLGAGLNFISFYIEKKNIICNKEGIRKKATFAAFFKDNGWPRKNSQKATMENIKP
jgi:hypothetical protein